MNKQNNNEPNAIRKPLGNLQFLLARRPKESKMET
tara:strand:+ start:190 stop:294 length:105 start_codon:yes stop_codon:yes gene_type:complete